MCSNPQRELKSHRKCWPSWGPGLDTHNSILEGEPPAPPASLSTTAPTDSLMQDYQKPGTQVIKLNQVQIAETVNYKMFMIAS